MHIVAVPVEPEYVSCSPIEGAGGAFEINLELCRMEVTEAVSGMTSGSIQIQLLPSDAKTIRTGISKLLLDEIVKVIREKHEFANDRAVDYAEKLRRTQALGVGAVDAAKRNADAADHWTSVRNRFETLLNEVETLIEQETYRTR